MTHTEFCYWLLGHIQTVDSKSYAAVDIDLVKGRLVKVLGEEQPTVALTPESAALTSQPCRCCCSRKVIPSVRLPGFSTYSKAPRATTSETW